MSIKNSVKSCLVIMAHPDDPELACGGSICRWAEEGKIYLIIVSDGGKGTWDESETPFRVAENREKEAEKAGKYMGVEKVIFLRHRDGDIENVKTLKLEIASLIRHFKPDTIVTHDPWTRQFHPDHRAVGWSVIRGIMIARDWHFYPFLPEIGLKPHRAERLLLAPTDKPDFVMDISDTIDKKIEAIKMHGSQIEKHEGWENRIKERSREIAADKDFEFGEVFCSMRI